MRNILILVSALALFCTNTTQAQDAMSVWRDSSITVDGRAKEWPSFFRFYISGAKVQFDFYNDSAYFYLGVKATDMEAQGRLMHSGLDVWFDPTGKKKQKTGFSFPLRLERAPGDAPPRTRASSDPSSGPSDRSRASRLREHVILAQNMIKVTGMAGVTEPMIPLQNKYGIEIAYDWDSLSILTIEYKVPLSLLLQHPVLASDLAHPLGVGIVVGAEEAHHSDVSGGPGGQPATRGGMNSGMGGSGSMGSGGRGAGGRGGGVQNNLANERFSTDNQEQKVWLKVHLETKPIVAP